VWLYHTVVTTSTNWIGKNAVLFNIIGWGPRALHPNIIQSLADRLSCPLWGPHFGRKRECAQEGKRERENFPSPLRGEERESERERERESELFRSASSLPPLPPRPCLPFPPSPLFLFLLALLSLESLSLFVRVSLSLSHSLARSLSSLSNYRQRLLAKK
jgi:hypothetical protein